MRLGPNSKRPRNYRGTPRRGPGHGRSHTLDSNGPEVKIRGNANQIFEKYLSLARDATSSGDRIMAENYLQHAEHYYRLVNGNAAGQRPQQQQQQTPHHQQPAAAAQSQPPAEAPKDPATEPQPPLD